MRLGRDRQPRPKFCGLVVFAAATQGVEFGGSEFAFAELAMKDGLDLGEREPKGGATRRGLDEIEHDFGAGLAKATFGDTGASAGQRSLGAHQGCETAASVGVSGW